MSNQIRVFTSELTWTEIQQIFEDFQILERDGTIGDCFLREASDIYRERFNIGDHLTIINMHLLAIDCYRIVAERAMADGFTI